MKSIFKSAGLRLVNMYSAIIVIIILIGVVLRTINLAILPPYRDEVFMFINTYFVYKDLFSSLGLKIGVFVNNFIMLLLLNLLNLRNIDISNYWTLTRYTTSLYGILLTIILTLIGREVINDRKLFLLYLWLIWCSTPILIHYSRISILSVQPVFFYYAAFLILLRIAKNNRLTSGMLCTIIIASALLSIAVHIHGARVAFYILAILITMVSILRRVLRSRINTIVYAIIAFTILVINVYVLENLQQGLTLVTTINKQSEIEFVLSKINTNPRNALLNILYQLHPDFIITTGGFNIASRSAEYFSRVLPLADIYRVNGGSVGVLGYWGIIIYVVVPLVLIIYFKKRKSLQLSQKIILEMFILLTLAYISSVAFYKYGVPHAGRNLYFFSFVPIASILVIDIISRGRGQIHRRVLSIIKFTLLTLIIIPSAVSFYSFTINYYRNGLNPLALHAFDAHIHHVISRVLSFLDSIIQYNSNVEKIGIIYAFKNHDRLVYTYAPIRTIFELYYTIKYFDIKDIVFLHPAEIAMNASFNTNANKLMEKRAVEIYIWTTTTPWLNYLYTKNISYAPRWLTNVDLLLIVSEKQLNNYSITSMESSYCYSLIYQDEIKVSWIKYYYDKVEVKEHLRMPSKIYMYTFMLNGGCEDNGNS